MFFNLHPSLFSIENIFNDPNAVVRTMKANSPIKFSRPDARKMRRGKLN